MPDARCEHGHTHACPHPRCAAGVQGAQLVVCGVEGARYYRRGFEVQGGEVVVAWVEFQVEEHQLRAVAGGR